MTDVELLRCPFCHRKPKLVKKDNVYVDVYDVCCHTPGCYLESGADYRIEKDDVVAMWNNRNRWKQDELVLQLGGGLEARFGENFEKGIYISIPGTTINFSMEQAIEIAKFFKREKNRIKRELRQQCSSEQARNKKA